MKRLAKTKLKKFKEIFLERKKNILAAHKNKIDEEIDVGGDEVDIVQGSIINEMVGKLSQRDKESLHKILEALQRIDAGTFGQCEECGEQIPEKRLVALPDCNYCVDCAEESEKMAKQYRKM